MREPVAKRRPMIDLDEFERRLRQPNSVTRRDGDPLAELARLVGGQEDSYDPYKAVFEPQSRRSAETWEESERVDPDAQDHLIGGDFAEIEAGLLAPREFGLGEGEAAAMLADVEDSSDFLAVDNGSEHWNYDSDPNPSQAADFTDGEIRSRRPLYLMATIIVIGMAGIGASFAFKSGVATSREIATIRAADGPAKIQPDMSANADVPNQDASILNRSPQASTVALVNTAEQPVDLSQIQERTPRVIALGGSRPRSDIGQTSGAVNVPVPQPPAPAASEAQAQGEALGIAALIEPKKVKTVSVRPDGTLLPNDKGPQIPVQVPTASAPRPIAEGAKASTPKTTARVATTPKLAPAVGAEGDQPLQSSNGARTRPVQTADAGAAATPDKTSQAGGGAFSVQLAAPDSEQEARDIQVRLMKKLGGELAGFHPSIRKAAIGDKTVYRVRVGNLSHDEANALCQKVQGAGGNCFVAKN